MEWVNIQSYLILAYSVLQAAPKSRPIGVTIIAILNIIGGIITLLGGIAFVVAVTIFPALPPSAFNDGNLTDSDIELSGIPPRFIGGVAIAIGSVLIAIGIVSFIVAYGLLKRMGWAWTVTVVLSIISIVFGTISGTLNAISIAIWNIAFSPSPIPFGAIVIIIISGIIIYYLYRPHVKGYFGKAAARTDATPAA
jgi:hypothetical protein